MPDVPDKSRMENNSGLPMEKLISSPLQAVCNAEVMLDAHSGTPGQAEGEPWEKNWACEARGVEPPLVSLVPIPHLIISEAEKELGWEVEASEQQAEEKENHPEDGGVEAKVPFR